MTTSRTAPLRVPAFRWFFLGQLVNSAGSSMSGIALAFAVLAISDSPAALGAVMAGWTVPMVAFMLLGGALADRMPRGLVLRGCNLVEAVAQTATAALVLTGYAEIWHLVVLQLVSGTASAVSYPAEHGMVPVLLPRELRQAGYLLMSQSRSATTIGGPAVAGLLVATAGPGYALAIDAATFFVAAGFLTLMRLPPGERPARQDSVIGDLRAGWSFARELGWVIPASSCALVFNALFAGAVGVLGPTIAEDTIGSEGWGLAQSAQAVGVFLTALGLSRVVIRRPMVVIMVAFAAMGLPSCWFSPALSEAKTGMPNPAANIIAASGRKLALLCGALTGWPRRTGGCGCGATQYLDYEVNSFPRPRAGGDSASFCGHQRRSGPGSSSGCRVRRESFRLLHSHCDPGPEPG